MCLKRKPPPKEREINTGEMQTKIRTVPISVLIAAESRSITKTKMTSRMAKLLGTAIHSGAMPNDWNRMAESLVDQADSVNPVVLVLDRDIIDGTPEQWTEALVMTLDELIAKVAAEKPYRTRKPEVETIVAKTIELLEAEVGVQLVTRSDKSE